MTNEMTSIVKAYDAETSVDQTIPIRRRMEALGDIVVTKDNVDEAKANRTALNSLLKDAAAPRMRVQRAIKSHPIGKWAFTKSQLEKDIELKANALKLAIDAQTDTAETLALKSERMTWVCFIEATLPEVNKLAVECNDRGWGFENRGPYEPAVENK